MKHYICRVKTDSQENLKNLQVNAPFFSVVYEAKGMKFCTQVPRRCEKDSKRGIPGHDSKKTPTKIDFPHNAAISFFHNHHPHAPLGICTENLSPLLGFCILIFARGGDFLVYVPRGWYLSINDFCHFWNFHCNRKNWQQTTLWSLISEILYVF